LIINGHNSNLFIMSQVINEITNKYKVRVMGLNYYDMAREVFKRIRNTSTGGSGHAGEFETSLMMYLTNRVLNEDVETCYVKPMTRYGFFDFMDRGIISQGFMLKKD